MAGQQKTMAVRVVGATLALVLAATPMTLRPQAGWGVAIGMSAAAAKDDGGNSGSGGGNSGSGSGEDNSNSGGGDNSGPGSSSSGHGGGDDDGGRDGDDDRQEDGGGGQTGRHGERIEIDGDRIRVIYPDGFKEEIRNGVFELKDPAGRTVVRRRATDKDFARMRALGT